MVKKLSPLIVTIALGFGTLLFYQNCMSSLPDTSGSTVKPSSVDPVPFAFDAKPDLIAFNSCYLAPANYNTDVLFNFRFKADTPKGGVGFSKEFKTYAGQNGINTDAKKYDAVFNSVTNRGANAHLAIRTVKDFALHAFDNKTPPILFSDYVGSVGGWDNLSERTPLVEIINAEKAFGLLRNYVRSDSTVAPFSLQIALGSGNLGDPEQSGTIFNNLTIGGPDALMLGFNTFASTSEYHMVTLPPDPTAKQVVPLAYARQFQFMFIAPSLNDSQRMAGRPARVINAIEEKQLNTYPPTNVGGWLCEPWSMEYKIAPNETNGAIGMGCPDPKQPGFSNKNYASGSAQLRNYTILNSILNDGISNSNWIIDVDSRCVYPVSGPYRACYSQMTIAADGVACGQAGQPQCPHYISVCTWQRTN